MKLPSWPVFASPARLTPAGARSRGFGLTALAIIAALALAFIAAWVDRADQSRSAASSAISRIERVQMLWQEQPLPIAQLLQSPDWRDTSLPMAHHWSAQWLWIKIDLRNPLALPEDLWMQISPPRLTEIQLWQQDANLQWQMTSNGAAVPLNERQAAVPEIVMPLALEASQSRTVLLAVRSKAAFNLHISLHKPSAWQTNASRQNLQDALLLGGLFALSVLAFVLTVIYRQVIMLLLGLRMLVSGLWQMQQLGLLSALAGTVAISAPTLIWLTENPWWLAWLTLMFTTGFTWAYMHLFKLPRWMHAVYALQLVLSAGLAIAILLGLSHVLGSQAIVVLAMMMLTLSVVLATIQLFKGHALAALVLGSSLTGVLLNLPIFRLLASDETEPLKRVFISPLPTLILAVILLAATALQHIQSVRRSRALVQKLQDDSMQRLEDLVQERTRQLAQASAEAAQANQAKGVFLAKVSHELRTPLHALMGQLHLLHREPMQPLATKRLSQSMHTARHMVAQINDLLDYTRTETDRFRLDPQPTALPALVRRVSEQAQRLALAQRNQFSSQLDPLVPLWVMTDGARLEQILMVLLDNASRYTKQGSIRLRVSLEQIETAPGQCRVLFEVSDTGRGIATEEKEAIFKPFERAQSVDSHGLGLGLPIARQLLEQMGGKFELKSALGEGSTFSFSVPFSIVGEPAVLPQDELADLPQGYEGRTRHLLVLDDHEPSRQFMLELLGDLGFEVLAFASNRQALEHLRSAAARGQWPDAMLIDQFLKFEDTGWAFLKSVSQMQSTHKPTERAPVIMISAALPDPPQTAEGEVLDHPDVHLLKPVNPQQLLQALQKLLGLQWRYEASNLPRPLEGNELPATPALAQIPLQADWQNLLQAAQSASLSDLEDWLANFGQHAPELDDLLDRLDFEGIAQLAHKRLAA